jgi:hypothetical protein
MRTLIEVKRVIWGKVKEFATVESLSLNSAVESLLMQALNQNGYSITKEQEARK